MANPKPIMTLGIEIEFLAVHKITPPVAPLKETMMGCALYNDLIAAGIPARGHEEPSRGPPREETFSRWHVGYDSSVVLTDEERRLLPAGWKAEPIELASKKYQLLDGRWRPDLERVLQTVGRMNGPQCKVFTNSYAGLHVHVGIAGGVVPLRTSKNVFQFCTAFEKQLDSIHCVDRIEIDQPHQPYNKGLNTIHDLQVRTAFVGGNEVRPTKRQGRFLFDSLYDIETITTPRELVEFFDVTVNDPEDALEPHIPITGHESTVNFENLIASMKRVIPTGTIEFRQHAGTLDINQITPWIILTNAIVSYCHTVPEVDFVALLLRALDPNFSLVDLLAVVGCAHLLKQFRAPYNHTSDTPTPHALQAFSAHNAAMNSANHDPARIDAAIQSKGRYSLAPAASRPHLHYTRDQCEQSLVAHLFRNDAGILDKDGARAVVLKLMAQKYRDREGNARHAAYIAERGRDPMLAFESAEHVAMRVGSGSEGPGGMGDWVDMGEGEEDWEKVLGCTWEA